MLQVALNFMGLRSKRGVSSKKSSSAVTVTLKAPEGLALENEHEEPEGTTSPKQDEVEVENTEEGTPSQQSSKPEPKYFWMDPAAQTALVELKARGEAKAAKVRAARAQPYVVKGFTVVNSSAPLTSEAGRAAVSNQWIQDELYGNRTRKRSWKVLNDRELTDA
ncbi:hypothetical protein Pmar_PMAR008787 [Perkinsus marinus ATCC 50983]|uniref:Uncharacterized protein n=1 Tax=Perkinsus marinus (strain ATCC 50983 / TXsc) TaxID=423536 RepID=C5L106_PERM5|nr:hypothetical protein Pmar_PMAR008787 [Perkinsus marinus ATCC 50983]EER09648.1 hypothetical protein Pmar_PMAR008787 [Perkinsus marinus ATCC 50983]|eukprot:XP_002777853.1 hypothetical protein Pmar_PMAR008787 [Perkinsus marinus ATCC 50983]